MNRDATVLRKNIEDAEGRISYFLSIIDVLEAKLDDEERNFLYDLVTDITNNINETFDRIFTALEEEPEG